MKTQWKVDDLEIVGYADVLTASMLPSVVPPVFRLRSDFARILVPPYSCKGGILSNATEITSAELQDLRDSREITLFETAFQARDDFELWVDLNYQSHYQPLAAAEQELGRISVDAIDKAKHALQICNLEEAERFSGIAISADDRRVEPLAIKAAIRRKQGDGAGERLMARLAAQALDDRLFTMLVDHYCGLIEAPKALEPKSTCRQAPWHDVATLKAA